MNHSLKTTLKGKDKTLIQGMSEENNTKVLAEIMHQLEAIRTTLDEVSAGIKRMPEVVEMATDTVDHLAQKAQFKGIDLEQRSELSFALMERLTHPKTMEKLNLLLDLSDQLPDFLSDAVNVVDETMNQVHQEGIDMAQRTQDIMHVLKRLSSPALIRQINSLLDFAEQGTDMLGLGVDLLDDTLIKINRQGVDVNQTLENTQKVLLAANAALYETLEESPQKIGGIFGLLRQLNDKDFQKVLAFLTTFGKYFGRNLGK